MKAVVLFGILLASTALAQTTPPSTPPGRPANVTPEMMQADAAARAKYNALPDTPGTGPYAANKEVDPTLPDHVVYRPKNLAAMGGKKLGVLVWGNGGCREDGASARFHLSEIASHGYLAIAPGAILSGPGAPPPGPVDTALGVKTTSEQVRAGIDWALKENARKDSPYYGRIDAKMVAVGGHSCGGLQALQVGGDPRVRTVLVHNSGVFTDGTNPIRGMTVDKSLLKTLHTPVLYVLGGPTDVAYPNGTDDFAKISHVPAVLLNLQVGHGGTFREPNGGKVAQVAVAWLDWQLRGDGAAAKMFKGADCTLCTNPEWTVERKGI
jgi:dienelactone hydrolase